MNFRKNPQDSLIRQEPTYHLAPNFTTRPFPDGPLQLGTVVEDLKQFWPLNQGDDRIPIPEGERYSDIKQGVKASLSKTRSGEVGVLAKLLDRSVGGDASLRGQRHYEDVYTVRKLETIYFYPRKSYISKCLELSDAKDFLEGSRYQEPVYLITGLKVAWGTTVSMDRGRQYDSGAKIEVTVPVDASVGAKARVAGETAMSTFHTKPADFVLGIQVLKLYHKKKFFSSDRALATERWTKGAVLVDNDVAKTDETGESEDNFVVAENEDGDSKHFIPEIEAAEGKQVTWIIPSDLVSA